MITRNEVLIHGTTWMNFENMLSEKSQSQKNTYCTIPFILNVKNKQIERQIRLVVAMGCKDWREMGRDCQRI